MAKIVIEIDTDRESIDSVLGQLGFVRLNNGVSGVALTVGTQDAHDPNAYIKAVAQVAEEARVEPVVVQHVAEPETALTDMDGDRKRGEAGPGHRRRTNVQIKDDEAYFAQKARAEAALAAMDKGVHGEMKIEGVSIDTSNGGASFTSAISTGAERVSPEDAADEAAETAARAGDAPTLEDLRGAVARYIEKFGHAASVKNMRGIVGCPVAEVPADQIPAAIAKVNAAIDAVGEVAAAPEESLFGGAPAAPVTATSAEVVDALKAYGRKYDGTDIAEQMIFGQEDLRRVFGMTFGADVTGLGSLPNKEPETLGKLLTAIKKATDENLFKREVK